MVSPARRLWAASALAALLATVATGVAAYPVWIAARSAVAARRALDEGDATSALVLARRGGAGPAVRFLEGRALMELGRWGDAATAFSSVVALEEEPESLRRALHNLALAELRAASHGDAGQAGLHARASVAAGREALRLDPRAAGTRWNLALAQRLLEGRRPDGAPTGGDRGSVLLGDGSQAGSSGAGGQPMTVAEANRILDALRSGETESLRAAVNSALETVGQGRTNRGPPW